MNLINRSTLIEHERLLSSASLHYANTGLCEEAHPFDTNPGNKRNLAQWPLELLRHVTYVQARHHAHVSRTLINVRCAYNGIAESQDAKGIPSPSEVTTLTLVTDTSCRVGDVEITYGLCNDMLYATRYSVAKNGRLVATGNVCKEFGELAFQDFDPEYPEREMRCTRSDFEVCSLFRLATCILAMRAHSIGN